MIKKKELYAHVAAATGQPKRDVRAVTDALFAYMNETLRAGEEIQYPPLGKIRVIVQHEGTEKERNNYKLVLASPKIEGETVAAEPDAAEPAAPEAEPAG